MRKENIIGGVRRKAFFLLLAIGVMVFSILGCASGPSSKSYSRPGLNIKEIRKVAVLPLENLSSEELAGEKVRRSLIAELLLHGVEVVEPGEVTRAMKELQVSSSIGIESSDIKKLGEILGVDYIMTGAVGSYAIRQGVTATYPEVSVQLMLVESSSGNILWSVWNTSGGPSFMTRHFGTEGISLSEAVRKVVKESIDMLF